MYNECAVLKTPIITTVSVSDAFFNVRDFAVLVEKNPEQIANAILNKEYKKIPVTALNFEEINHGRLALLERII